MAKKLEKAQLGKAMKLNDKVERLGNRRTNVATRLVKEERKGADANFNKVNRLRDRFDNLRTKQQAAEDGYNNATKVTVGDFKKGGAVKKITTKKKK